jgi:hypothetical protein
MNKDKALEIALEALELHGKQYPHMVKGYCLDAIKAIKEALKTKDEPVAWRFQSSVGGWAYGKEPPIGSKYAVEPLYTTPQRTWVGLTDEEIESTYMDTINFQENARALEVKLKQKNYDFPNKLQD